MPTGRQEPARVLAPPVKNGALSLEDSLQYLKGVGPQAAALLAKIGLVTVADLLRHIPRRWEDRTRFRRVAEVQSGELVTVCGVVIAVNTTYPKPRLQITKALLDDTGSALTLTWFNQPYLEKTFKGLAASRRPVVVYGQARRVGWSLEIQNPEWEELGEDGDTLSTNRIVPVYPATEGVRQVRLRRMVDAVLQTYLPLVEETLPPEVILRHRLVGAQTAVRNIHFPESWEDLQAARRRLVFEEFFLLQTLLAIRRRAHSRDVRGIPFEISLDRLRADLAEIVPFTLTGAQQRTIAEIAADMGSGRVMNRLLQGDVGSGKTMVALAAMLMAVENGCQAALMAPTEILAQQHAIVLGRLLEPLGLAVELALGSQTQKEKASVRDRLLSGQSRLVVGTHALIQEGLEFARLGLVIVDEQHRFGVLQRQALRQKGERPHVLVMTATPIPRTLTLTLYGDLDVSVLDELPPGRKPITTHWKTPDKRAQVYAAAQRLLMEGRQVYVVCPLIEESEKLQAKSATQLSEHIANDVFPQYRVGLLHGQMKPDEKDAVMARFKAHELDVLVSTTVIEVGIDVPNASVIVIEDADRFGLAQLHQLRGRVGRGQHASFCILMADPKTEEGRARMEVMTATTDGFKIAEEDLRLRGPGEFYGTRQSGMPELYIADIIQDREILAETRETAFQLVEADPKLSRPEHQPLRRALERMRHGLELT
ncbi:MAG TPA: ATP-dependent DNA helicase RecG [Chthonomonadaceae bacterium]|nr:ATP-dependent DNA helicase RecG [Chthonomonadaceae bacterium]